MALTSYQNASESTQIRTLSEQVRDSNRFMNLNTSFIIPSMMSEIPMLYHHLQSKAYPETLHVNLIQALYMVTECNYSDSVMQDALTGDWRNGSILVEESVLCRWGVSMCQSTPSHDTVSNASLAVLTICGPAQNISAGQIWADFPIKRWVSRTLSRLIGHGFDSMGR